MTKPHAEHDHVSLDATVRILTDDNAAHEIGRNESA
jgi:hypothetical protein